MHRPQRGDGGVSPAMTSAALDACRALRPAARPSYRPRRRAVALAARTSPTTRTVAVPPGWPWCHERARAHLHEPPRGPAALRASARCARTASAPTKPPGLPNAHVQARPASTSRSVLSTSWPRRGFSSSARVGALSPHGCRACARGEQRLVRVRGLLRGHVQLVAELADVREATTSARARARARAPRGRRARRRRGGAAVEPRPRARARARGVELRERARDVEHGPRARAPARRLRRRRASTARRAVSDAREVVSPARAARAAAPSGGLRRGAPPRPARARRVARVELPLPLARRADDGEVGLDAAVVVEPLRVRDAAGRPVDVGGRDAAAARPRRRAGGRAACHEAPSIERPRPPRTMRALGGPRSRRGGRPHVRRRPPRRARRRSRVARAWRARRRGKLEPVGAHSQAALGTLLASVGDRAEARAGRAAARVRAAHRLPPAPPLLYGQWHAYTSPSVSTTRAARPRWFAWCGSARATCTPVAPYRPAGCRPSLRASARAEAARGEHADHVEARADVEAVELGALADERRAVGREASRAIEELMSPAPCALARGHAIPPAASAKRGLADGPRALPLRARARRTRSRRSRRRAPSPRRRARSARPSAATPPARPMYVWRAGSSITGHGASTSAIGSVSR